MFSAFGERLSGIRPAREGKFSGGIERKALCVGASLVPARFAAGFGQTGDHKGRPYERTDRLNFG